MKYATNNYVGATDPHHAQMFESYLGVMADALQEFNTGIPVPNGAKATQLYQNLSMSTMVGTQLFKDRYRDDYNAPNFAERQRILHTRLAENNNTTVANYTPQGKPCN